MPPSPRHYSLRERLELLPRVNPFLVGIAGVLYAMYGGIAMSSLFITQGLPGTR